MRRVKGTAAMLALLTTVAAALLVVGWYVSGGRWYVVRTPSMGTAAPVGTLLWVRPVSSNDLHVGDVITFRAPRHAGTYSHRIVAVDAASADRTYTTKGDLTSPDPWRLSSRDVVGKVEARWWGVGWVPRMAPALIVAALLVLGTTTFVPPGRRQAVAVLGVSVAVSVVLVGYRPLTGVERLGPPGSPTFVATGVLPVRLEATPDVSGGSETLHPGEAMTLRPSIRRVDVAITPMFAWWGWVLLVGGCLGPAGVATVRRSRRRWTAIEFGSSPPVPTDMWSATARHRARVRGAHGVMSPG